MSRNASVVKSKYPGEGAVAVKSTVEQPRHTGKSSTPVANAGKVSTTVIAEKAYQLWQVRGRGHGDDLKDWFEAEKELLGLSKQAR